MKKILAAVLSAACALGAVEANAGPEQDRMQLVSLYKAKFNGVPLDDYVYGALIASPDSKMQYDDIMAFPPFQSQLEDGKKLWETPFRNGKSFASCFPDGGRNVAGNYPYFDDALGKVVTFEMAINKCLRDNGEAEFKHDDMNTMGLVTAYARTLSDGMRMNIKVEGPAASAAYERGKQLFFGRRGQFDFSCATCHVSHGGDHIRNEFLSPVVGQATHWPVFRAPGDDLWTLQKRYVGCYKLIRAVAPPVGSEDFNNLEYFHSYQSNGLPMKAAVFRK